MIAREVMTPNPYCCSKDDTAQEVARLMRDHDCGSLPVVDPESGRVIGIVTDRDLAVRGVATGRAAGTRVVELMTANPCCCAPGDDVRVIEHAMAVNQVRRIPIVEADGSCIGIVAQADLARAVDTQQVSEHEVALTVERISEPKTRPEERRPQRSLESRFLG